MIVRTVIIVLLALALSGCSVFGGKKTRLVPQAYMPEPPAVLMQLPKELHTIKNNTTEAPKK
jgi:type IV pilus biogenesis protein CpaD/CtpE